MFHIFCATFFVATGGEDYFLALRIMPFTKRGRTQVEAFTPLLTTLSQSVTGN